MMSEHVIRMVGVLKGRAKDEATKMGLSPNDLVIVTTILHPLPEYRLEKIEGDPITFLLSKIQSLESEEKTMVSE